MAIKEKRQTNFCSIMGKVDLTNYKSELGKRDQIKRLIWQIVWLIFAKPFPKRLGNSWKIFLLKLFGAKIHKTAVVYSSAKVYAPWNLEMEEYACLASQVDCYNVDKVFIGKHTTISQKSYLCTASHDISKGNFSLITAPIIIEESVWIAAASYIAPGVTVMKGAVVGATASVYKNVEAWNVVGGNPAKVLKIRKIK